MSKPGKAQRHEAAQAFQYSLSQLETQLLTGEISEPDSSPPDLPTSGEMPCSSALSPSAPQRLVRSDVGDRTSSTFDLESLHEAAADIERYIQDQP